MWRINTSNKPSGINKYRKVLNKCKGAKTQSTQRYFMFLSQYTCLQHSFGIDPVSLGSCSDYCVIAESSDIQIKLLCALCASAPLR
jgi:hypothetical protein